MVAGYDHSCFRSPKQRAARSSLRLGISPDYTLAYIDFLFNEEAFEAVWKPLCPLGQPKLPAAFRFAGLGSYFTPWTIDTNDMLLQAIPQTDLASEFIDEVSRKCAV